MDDKSGNESGSEQLLPSSESQETKNESGSEEWLTSSESQGTRSESGSEETLPTSTSQGTKSESGSEESLQTSTSQGTKSESGSEESLPTSTSQGTSISDSQKNKKQRRCDVCKKYVDEDTMKSWSRRNDETGAKLYCQSYSDSAPDMWTCAECNNSTRAIESSTGSDTSRTNQVQGPNDQAASSSTTNQVVDNEVVQKKTTSDDSCNEISATNPPSQTHARPTEASPPMKKQKTSDNDAPSDSESAK